MSTCTLTLDSVLTALEQATGHAPQRSGHEWICRCPVHDDGTPSLSVGEGDNGKILLHCHAGCSYESIAAAIGIAQEPAQDAKKSQRRIIATYSYRDAAGTEVRQKLRYEPKDFRIRHGENGEWIYRSGAGPAVLYRLPELREGIALGRTVIIPEGEKDVDRLASDWLTATTNIEGASEAGKKPKWRSEYTEQLSGAACIVLLPDNDPAGRAHMAAIAQALRGTVADVRIVNLPGLPPKGDVSDWLDAGHTVDELMELIEQARPVADAGDSAGESTQFSPDDGLKFDKHDPRLMRKSGSSDLLKNLLNATLVTEYALPGMIGYNEFRQQVELRIPTPWRKEPGAWTENDTCEFAVYITKDFAAFNLDMLRSAINTVAHRHTFNPAQDKLRAMAEQWDGVPRLGTWMIDYLNAGHNGSNDTYLKETGEAWMKGVAARVLKPGCKRDDVLVLRGPQGWRKSTAAQCIADAIHLDAFTDNLGDLSSKDSRSGIRGMIIAELGELAALNKSDIESIKSFVAAKVDHFREAYGRGDCDYPRTVSFIGTTNDPTFLKDPSGNRRWWPVTISAPIDIDRMEAALPQVIGEAARRVLDGEPWYVQNEVALAQADAVRAAHFADDVWTDAVLDAAMTLMQPNCTLPGSHPEYVTVSAIMGAMGIRIEQQTVPNSMRVGAILRVNGWTDKRKRMSGRKIWIWYPPVSPAPSAPPGGYRGGSQKPSQTADVPPAPPVPPYFEHSGKNGFGSDTVDDVVTPDFDENNLQNLAFVENRGGKGGQGGTPSQTAGDLCTPLKIWQGGQGGQRDTSSMFTAPNPVAALSPDAAAAWQIIKLMSGAETIERLSKRLYFDSVRCHTACRELASAGLATINGQFIKRAGGAS